MRVIREGKVPNPWPKEELCETCHAMIELDPDDIDYSDNQRDPYARWLCPLCKDYNYLDTHIISEIVKEKQRRTR